MKKRPGKDEKLLEQKTLRDDLAYKEQWQPELGFHRFKKGRLSDLPIYFRDEEKIRGLMFLLPIDREEEFFV